MASYCHQNSINRQFVSVALELMSHAQQIHKDSDSINTDIVSSI